MIYFGNFLPVVASIRQNDRIKRLRGRIRRPQVREQRQLKRGTQENHGFESTISKKKGKAKKKGKCPLKDYP